MVVEAYAEKHKIEAETIRTRDEKRFFGTTLKVDGVVVAPDTEIIWASRFLAEQNMSDPEFQTFKVKIRRYKSFVVNHPDRVPPPAWAKGKFE